MSGRPAAPRQPGGRRLGVVAPRALGPPHADKQPLMDVFAFRNELVAEYERFSRSFARIRAEDISREVDAAYAAGAGADVAMLVRRVRERFNERLLCIGTSATIAFEGSPDDRDDALAAIASRLFGAAVDPGNVVSETLRPVTDRDVSLSGPDLRAAVERRVPANPTHEALAAHPVAIWVERNLGLEEHGGKLVRTSRPLTILQASDRRARALRGRCRRIALPCSGWDLVLRARGAARSLREHPAQPVVGDCHAHDRGLRRCVPDHGRGKALHLCHPDVRSRNRRNARSWPRRCPKFARKSPKANRSRAASHCRRKRPEDRESSTP